MARRREEEHVPLNADRLKLIEALKANRDKKIKEREARIKESADKLDVHAQELANKYEQVAQLLKDKKYQEANALMAGAWNSDFSQSYRDSKTAKDGNYYATEKIENIDRALAVLNVITEASIDIGSDSLLVNIASCLV